MEFRRVSLKVSSLVCYSQIHRPRSLLRNQVNTNNGTVLLAGFPICETLWRRCGQHLPCAPALQFWGTRKRLRSVLMVQDELPKRHTHSLLLSHCPGCGNKHDRLGGWKDRHLLLTVPEAAGRDQRASLVGIWWGPPPRLTDAALLLCLACQTEEALVSLPLLIKTWIPSWGALPSWPHLNLIPSQGLPIQTPLH